MAVSVFLLGVVGAGVGVGVVVGDVGGVSSGVVVIVVVVLAVGVVGVVVCFCLRALCPGPIFGYGFRHGSGGWVTQSTKASARDATDPLRT